MADSPWVRRVLRQVAEMEYRVAVCARLERLWSGATYDQWRKANDDAGADLAAARRRLRALLREKEEK